MKPKTVRNARIVRLRDESERLNRPFSWARIAHLVSREFPGQAIGESQARGIYKLEKKHDG